MIPEYKISADASFYYREDARADLASMDSSAVYGNLADVMKNATILFPPPQIIQKLRTNSQPENSKE